MLVQSMRQFLASSLQLLSKGEAMKHNSILQNRDNGFSFRIGKGPF